MFITAIEIFDMLITIALVGFLFMDAFKAPKTEGDELSRYIKQKSRFHWHDFWFAAMVTAPAILLHELGHKITAISLGHQATFHAFYASSTTLFLGLFAIAMKILNFGLLFLVPGFVSITGVGNSAESAVIAFAGPGVNLLLFLIAFIVVKTQKLSTKKIHFWVLTKNINLFLLIFNLLPIPGFDGFTVFSGLWKIIGI